MAYEAKGASVNTIMTLLINKFVVIHGWRKELFIEEWEPSHTQEAKKHSKGDMRVKRVFTML